MQCKRASIGLKARAFLLHLERELHLAFHPCKKTVRGLFQRRCKEGSESPLCMLFALKYSFTARPLEGPFMLRKLSVNRNQAQRAWKAIVWEFKHFQFKLSQIRAALNLQPDFTPLYKAATMCSLGLAGDASSLPYAWGCHVVDKKNTESMFLKERRGCLLVIFNFLKRKSAFFLLFFFLTLKCYL